MASPTETRTVSELIEVWQDWTTFIEQKKRQRRWTMDETLRASDSELGNEDGRGKRKKKRGRYSDGHDHQVLRNCMSFPEEMDASFVHEVSFHTAAADINDLSLQLDISDVQDVNVTHLSLGDAINDSIVHIGCIDSDGNPLDVSGEQPKQQAVRRPTDASTDSPDELRLYSSIGKSIDIVTPMKLASVFKDKECSETDRSTREGTDAVVSAGEIEAETTSPKSARCQSALENEQVSNYCTEQQQDGLDQTTSEKTDAPITDSPASMRCDSVLVEGKRHFAEERLPQLENAISLHNQESNSQPGINQVLDQLSMNNGSENEVPNENDQEIPDHCSADDEVTNQNDGDGKSAITAVTCASTEQTNVEPEITNSSSIDCERASESDENLDPKSASRAPRERKTTLNTDDKVSNELNVADVKKTALLDGANVRVNKKLAANISAEKSVDATDMNGPRGNNLLSVTFKDERKGAIDDLNISSHQPHDTSTVSQKHHQENNPPNRTQPQHGRNSLKSNRKKSRSHTALVEQNATFAFSPYRAIIHFSSMDKNERPRNGKSNQTNFADDPVQSTIQQPNDSVLEQYLDEMNAVNEFYAKAQPFRMGNRDIPFNQVEVVLRRRAIKKPEKVQSTAISSSGSLDDRSTQSSTIATRQGLGKQPQISRMPPRESQSITTSRRTLFPNIPGHSRSHSLGMDTTFEDDSTISSATVSTTWTAGNTSTIVSVNNASVLQSTDPILEESCKQMPQEEVVGDTSLGLKLTILHGKVIIQAISPLEDGRASPAQLCGLFCPGDVLVAVNDSPLIIGSIHTPVPMDKMVSALKPLSEPIHEDGRYSREVRLRFVIGEGRKLLREQKEREIRKQRVINERKKLGLDGKAGSASVDHAADIFGLSALMGVDQHTGLPMFQQHHLETYHDEEIVEETVADATVNDTPIDIASDSDKQLFRPSFFTKTPPLIQTRISQQLANEREWTRNHNTSDFFTLDNSASLLLRAPLPPAIEQYAEDQLSQLNPIEARQKRLELGAVNVSYAKELVSIVEKQERGIGIHDDEDPMEVASRVCGTASVRTGASRRRWHRGDSVLLEDAQSTVVSASSMDNQADTNTLHSAESVEMCDHRLLVELAANNLSWKRNVIQRLEDYAAATEKAIHEEHIEADALAENEVPSSLDSLLFGSEVAKILMKKKSSLALPPGEITQMLFDLKEHLESGLPMHIFTSEDALTLNGSEKAVTFAKTPHENDIDVANATNFLINEALGIWLKSFRPLPWKQRRALWPLQPNGLNGESSSMVSSHYDDGMSLSLASGGTYSTTKAEKRNLREIIEELELDPETRRETCSLVTFYFTRTYQPNRHLHLHLSEENETMALNLIDSYGSYLDLYKTLVLAGMLQCQSMITKLVSLAKYDPHHKEAIQRLQKAKVLMFYEPNMLSALHELLQSGSYNSMSSPIDAFYNLLVSAYPDLPPMSVKAAAASNASAGDFYFNYMSLIMHPEEGSDLAKRDGSLVKEWCSMLCSSVESHDKKSEDSIACFLQIASASDEYSSLYHRDLPFLLDISIKMSQYNLALEIAKEMMSSLTSKRDNSASVDLLQHIRHISEISIVENVDSVLLGQVVAFYTDMSRRKIDGFNIASELTKIFQQCIEETQHNPSYDILSNLNACLTVLAENASPSDGIKVLSQLDLPVVDQQSKIHAIRNLLTRGARENVGSEISGSLLRIQRVREERRRFEEENFAVYNLDNSEATDDDTEESGGFIWPSILEGRVIITK